MTDNYDDIINLPHHVSDTHPRMSLLARAAQFAPFSALNGLEAAITERGRLTEHQLELDKDELDILNQRMNMLLVADDNPVIAITYFKHDNRKSGGKYITKEGHLKCVDDRERVIILDDGTKIPQEMIISIDSHIFNKS